MRFRVTHSSYLLLAVLCLEVSLSSCSTGPQTERSRPMLFSETKEIELGKKAFRVFLEKPGTVMVTDPTVTQQASRVFERLVDAAKASSYANFARQLEWEVVVIQNDQTAGVCFPGGKVGVNTGLLRYVESDDELSGAMGYLIASILARHSAEQLSRTIIVNYETEKVRAESGPFPSVKSEPKTEEPVKWEQAQREEADRIGVRLMAQAGYDPTAILRFWRRSQGPDSVRAKQVEPFIPEAAALHQRKDK